MITASGRLICAEDFATLDLSTLSWRDMQQAMSRLYRFSGAGISVAEHSLRMYHMSERENSPAFSLACLLHDVEELVGMVDIPRPEKNAPIWASIVHAQRAFGKRVFDHYHISDVLTPEEAEKLAQWDLWASWVEAESLPSAMSATVVRLWGDPPQVPADWHRQYCDHVPIYYGTDLIFNKLVASVLEA